MRTRLHTLTLALITAAIAMIHTGCTHNNGDIGPWFGTWHLDSVTIDGKTDGEYQGNIFWCFQSDVIRMVVVDDATHTRSDHWGTWSEDDNQLFLKYTYSDDTYKPGQGVYSPAHGIGLASGVTALTITSGPGSGLKLTHTLTTGETYTYVLSKW